MLYQTTVHSGSDSSSHRATNMSCNRFANVYPSIGNFIFNNLGTKSCPFTVILALESLPGLKTLHITDNFTLVDTK